MRSEHQYYLNGDEPSAIGKTCAGFYLMQHQVAGALSNPATSAYFNFDERWLQLCFDGNTIFWRNTTKPQEPVNDRLSTVLVLLNLSEMPDVVGRMLESIEYWGSEAEVGTSLKFSGGCTLAFKHISDRDITIVTNQSRDQEHHAA